MDSVQENPISILLIGIKQAGVRAIEENDTHYTPVGGTNDLKDAIITKLKRDNGLSYERNQILASCGAKQSFYNLAQVLWGQGDEVIIPAPYWVSFPEMVVLAGAKPVIIETGPANEFKITVDQIKGSPNTKHARDFNQFPFQSNWFGL